MKQKSMPAVTVLATGQPGAFTENGPAHTPYEVEQAFFSAIRRGDVAGMRQSLAGAVVVGRLSNDGLRQAQYWAVCCITLGVRSAIEGGLPERTAFGISDDSIRRIDGCTGTGQVEACLGEVLVQLATLVHDATGAGCPAPVRKCIAYIDRHLHETIRLSDLARATSFSGDYISRLFKKHMGTTLRAYILERKLAAAQELLRAGQDSRAVAYALGFCSQTYFITCFKNAYGITPHRYAMGKLET